MYREEAGQTHRSSCKKTRSQDASYLPAASSRSGAPMPRRVQRHLQRRRFYWRLLSSRSAIKRSDDQLTMTCSHQGRRKLGLEWERSQSEALGGNPTGSSLPFLFLPSSSDPLSGKAYPVMRGGAGRSKLKRWSLRLLPTGHHPDQKGAQAEG